MSELSSVSIDRVKVLVLGDSGVGKTTLVYLIASNHALARSPGWTAGCNVEVRYHEYAAGTSREKPYFIELWDIGGCAALQTVRPLFYGGAHGYILVHDLTNRKSLHNIKTAWLSELQTAATSTAHSGNIVSTPWSSSQVMSSSGTNCLLPPQAPCILVGTKLDAVTTGGGADSYLPLASRRRTTSSAWPGLSVSITPESIGKAVGGAEHITVDCHNSRSLAPGSSNAVAISRFFDKVIDAKLSLAQSGHMLSSANSSAFSSAAELGNSANSSPTSSLLASANFASRLSGSNLYGFQQSNSQSSTSPLGFGTSSARDRHRTSGLLK